jgi:hypothetical protein
MFEVDGVVQSGNCLWAGKMGEDFSLSTSGSLPASYTMGVGGSFPTGKITRV